MVTGIGAEVPAPRVASAALLTVASCQRAYPPARSTAKTTRLPAVADRGSAIDAPMTLLAGPDTQETRQSLYPSAKLTPGHRVCHVTGGWRREHGLDCR